MSWIYGLLLLGVGVAVLAAAIEAMLVVTRRPRWPTGSTSRPLTLVETSDRRQETLPFVGADRRKPSGPSREEDQRLVA